MLNGAEIQTLGRHQLYTLLTIEVNFWCKSAKISTKGENYESEIREITNVQHNIIRVMEKKTIEMVWKFKGNQE